MGNAKSIVGESKTASLVILELLYLHVKSCITSGFLFISLSYLLNGNE